jgi:pimeloyl-ACP methyl ester carboxylesterase
MPPSRAIYRSEQGRQAIEDFYRGALAQAAVPLRTRFVATSQGRTHLIEAGPEDGDVVLLLHGSASNSATWLGDMPVWSREFRVSGADLPGHPGLSEARTLVLSSDATATWLDSLLGVIGTDSVRLVGMSLGGWIALDFACRYPDRVRALSLLSPGGLAPAKRSFLFKALPLSLLGDWGSDRIQRLVFRHAEVPQPVLEFGRLVARHYRPVTERVPVLGDAELSRLRMPIQFFGGAEDALSRAEDSAERLARLLPHAEVHLLPDHGHAILGQTEAILRFLRDS